MLRRATWVPAFAGTTTASMRRRRRGPFRGDDNLSAFAGAILYHDKLDPSSGDFDGVAWRELGAFRAYELAIHRRWRDALERLETMTSAGLDDGCDLHARSSNGCL